MTTLGVIGLGRIGAFHTDTLSGIDGVDGLVVADERPDVVAAVAAKHGAKPADSVEELLASGVDGVVVSSKVSQAAGGSPSWMRPSATTVAAAHCSSRLALQRCSKSAPSRQ